MRTNNSKAKNFIISVYFVLIVLAIFFATVFSAFTNITSNPFLTFVIILLAFVTLFVLIHWISKYFEYDSDGVKVVVLNKGLLTDKFTQEYQVEFKKENLLGFKFNNYIIFRTLVLYIKDYRGYKTKEVFNVSLVNKKKRKYIRQSLSKMIKNNRKQKIEVND